MSNLPNSDELAGYYYLTNPMGYGLQAYRTKEGAEAYIERREPGAHSGKWGKGKEE